MKFNETLGVFEGAISPELCDEIVSRFNNAQLRGETYTGQSGSGENNEIKSSTDFDLLSSTLEDDIMFGFDFISQLNDIVVNDYLGNFPHQDKDNPVTQLFSSDTFYELLQIQKYDKGQGHYNAWHAETGTYEMSRRLFSFLLYLNDVEEGGETDFLYIENEDGEMMTIKPQKGKILIHPASFPYVHRGRTPVSDDKYILTTWLSYEPQ